VENSPNYLDPQVLARLEGLQVRARRIVEGYVTGVHRSPYRGFSIEFAEHREYAPGDDLRYLDWNAFARLQRLFLKLFIEEEDLHVYLVLDGSRSMDFGSPSKFTWATQAAAALSYIALCGGDRVQAYFCAGEDQEVSRLFRGRGGAPELFQWLANRSPGGEMKITAAVRALQAMAPAPGLTFLISDLLTPEWEEALARLAASKGEACVLQVFTREEFAPPARGDLRLIDSETAEDREITMGSSVLRRYTEERDRFLGAVRAACNRYGFSYLFAVSEEPVEDVILKSLRRLQVIK